MKRMVMAAAYAAGMACMAQSVTSEFVPVRAPGNVFDPIPEAAGGNDTARLVDTPEVFSAAYVEDFAIDGDMAKKVWRDAPSVPALVPMKGREFQYATEVKLLYSATSLYVGATFHQPMETLRAQYDQDDQSVYNDDCLEILFLVPSGKGEDMLHLSVNALGSCYDAKNGRSVWNLKRREIKTKRLADRWTLEMRLPFAGLGIERPVPGDFIGARFCRGVHEPKFGRATMPQRRASTSGASSASLCSRSLTARRRRRRGRIVRVSRRSAPNSVSPRRSVGSRRRRPPPCSSPTRLIRRTTRRYRLSTR